MKQLKISIWAELLPINMLSVESELPATHEYSLQWTRTDGGGV